MQDTTSRRTEARVSLFAADPAKLGGFGTIRAVGGDVLSLADLRAGEVYLDRDAADDLGARARPGDGVCGPVGGIGHDRAFAFPNVDRAVPEGALPTLARRGLTSFERSRALEVVDEEVDGRHAVVGPGHGERADGGEHGP